MKRSSGPLFLFWAAYALRAYGTALQPLWLTPYASACLCPTGTLYLVSISPSHGTALSHPQSASLSSHGTAPSLIHRLRLSHPMVRRSLIPQ